MKTIRYSVSVGSEIQVDDNATREEIEKAIEEDKKSLGFEDEYVDWIYDETNGIELLSCC